MSKRSIQIINFLKILRIWKKLKEVKNLNFYVRNGFKVAKAINHEVFEALKYSRLIGFWLFE